MNESKAMLELALAAYNAVWDNSGCLDAENVDEVRRSAMEAALRASAPQEDGRAVREALEFYAREWQLNGDGDPETPGLSRSWMEPTDALHDDEGRKAKAALAALTSPQPGGAVAGTERGEGQ